MLAQLGRATDSIVRFWGCDNTNTGGVLGVIVNGKTYTGANLTAATDYTGTIDVAVSGDFTWQLTLDGVAVTPLRTAKGQPSSGQGFRTVIWGDSNNEYINGWQVMVDEAADYGVCIGDWDYTDTETGFVRDANLSSYRPRHRAKLGGLTGWTPQQEFLCNQLNIAMHDSHEGIRGDIFAEGTPEYNAAYQAIREYITGINPANTDTGVHASPAVTPYFRHKIGDVEFIMLEQATWLTGASESLGQSIDATQLAWFQSAIANSTASVIVVCAPKQPRYVAGVNTVWPDVFRAIDAVDKTVVVFSADSHGAVATWRAKGTTMAGGTITDAFANRGLLEVQGTPISHPTMTAGDGITSGQATQYFFDNSNDTGFRGSNFNYVMFEYVPQGGGIESAPHIRIDIKSCWTGRSRWTCTIPIGSRVPTVYEGRARAPVI